MTHRDTLTPVPPDDWTFELWQDGIMVASTSGPKADALREIRHYATQYAEDGPVEIRDANGTQWSSEDSKAAYADIFAYLDRTKRMVGIDAAHQYLASHATAKPPFPWLYLVAVLFIVAVLVAVCAVSWDAIAAGVAFLGLAPAAGSQFFADAGRDAGVVR